MQQLTTTFNAAVASKRKDRDIMKLMMSDYKVKRLDNNSYEFSVEFQGPQDTPYEGGIWQVHVLLPEQYPYQSPSIGFINKIFHPNIDEASGSVCLDVINQTWSPMYELINVFDVFLPQLLSYPNPKDPLNSDAAHIQLKDKKFYEQKIKEYVKKYAMSQQQEPSKQQLQMSPSLLQIDQRKSSDEMEEEIISNISLDNVSELSQNSLDLEDEATMY